MNHNRAALYIQRPRLTPYKSRLRHIEISQPRSARATANIQPKHRHISQRPSPRTDKRKIVRLAYAPQRRPPPPPSATRPSAPAQPARQDAGRLPGNLNLRQAYPRPAIGLPVCDALQAARIVVKRHLHQRRRAPIPPPPVKKSRAGTGDDTKRDFGRSRYIFGGRNQCRDTPRIFPERLWDAVKGNGEFRLKHAFCRLGRQWIPKRKTKVGFYNAGRSAIRRLILAPPSRPGLGPTLTF